MLKGDQSHKKVDLSTNFFLRLYYTSRVIIYNYCNTSVPYCTCTSYKNGGCFYYSFIQYAYTCNSYSQKLIPITI